MTSANRCQSPVLKETLKRKAPEMILDENKVNFKKKIYTKFRYTEFV